MRRAIDSAPKDGKFVILEDDASGSFELAQWSAEARAWVRENGELSKITPTYWHTTQRDHYLPQEGDELQKETESSHLVNGGHARFASAVRLSLRGGDGVQAIRDVQGDGTPTFEGHHLPGRDLAGRLFPSGQAAPQRPVAADAGIALRQVAKADAFTVARLEARAAQGKSERGPPARRWFAVSSIAAAMAAALLTGMYFQAELAAYVTRYIGKQDNVRTGTAGVEAVEQETQVPSQDSQKADSLARDPALHQQADRANSQAPRDTAQGKQGAVAMQPEAQQPLEKERRRAEALANELVKAQQVIAMQVELAGKARDQAAQLSQAAESGMAELRQSLQKEHDRAEALAGELAKARRDLETQLALPSKARDQAAQLKRAAEKATAELRQSLKTEHDRAEALTGELAKARRDLETQLALSSKAGDEAAQLKQLKEAAESATVELRQSLQQERERAEALTSELARARRDLETQVALSSKAGDEAAQLKQLKAAESATAELRLSLQMEHERAEALSSELATARTTVYAYEAQARKASDQAADLKQAAESAALELQKPLQQERERAARLEQDLAAARRDVETQLALSSKAGDEAAQLKQLKAVESATAELRLSLQMEHERAEALSSELVTARTTVYAYEAQARKAGDRAADLKQAAESAALELQKPLQRERAARLEQDLAAARRDVETQVALSRMAGQEAAQVKQAAESATVELRQSLQQERERAEALTSELARARRDLETQLALSSKAGDEAAQLKQVKEATESATAELRQSLQQERDRVQDTQPTIGARIEGERASNSQIAQVTQAAQAAATEQPAAAEAQGSPEAARLLARASALLGQGNIGAARIVLERAIETGSAQASFMLAETYDPLVLSKWKTYGTRGDVTKARELYAKALAGGIQEAKDRSVALR